LPSAIAVISAERLICEWGTACSDRLPPARATRGHADGRPLDIGGRKLRALLALFLLNANELVPRDFLVDRLWGERPPTGSARRQLPISPFWQLILNQLRVR